MTMASTLAEDIDPRQQSEVSLTESRKLFAGQCRLLAARAEAGCELQITSLDNLLRISQQILDEEGRSA
jgi:hypothetical protein